MWRNGYSVHVLWIVSGGLLLLMSCGGDAGSGVGGRPTSGSLGQVDVAPECGTFNQACLNLGLNAPLALNTVTELNIDFRMSGMAGMTTILESTDKAVLAVDNWQVEARSTGVAGLLFVDSDGAILDFIHVWVARPEELRILSWSQRRRFAGGDSAGGR